MDLEPANVPRADVTAAESVDLDALGFGSLAWLRRASADARLPAWRLTPSRLAAYVTAVRALAYAGEVVEVEDPGVVLDVERQPLLRPWEYPLGWPGPTDPDPATALASLIAERPALAAAVRRHTTLEEFAAAHLKLTLCARALVLLYNADSATVPPQEVQAWAESQQPAAGAEADFAASLVTMAESRELIEGAFSL